MAQQALHTSPPRATDRFDWLVTVRGIIVSPSATFSRLADGQFWRQGVAFYMVVAVGSALVDFVASVAAGTDATDPELAGRMAFVSSLPFQVISVFLIAPLVLLAMTGLLYQIGLRQGGDGPFARLFTTEVFSSGTIILVSLPLSLIALLVPRSAATGIGMFDIVTGLGIAIWSLVLTVFSVRASMRLSTGSAVAVVIMAIIAGAIFFGLAFCVLGGILQ